MKHAKQRTDRIHGTIYLSEFESQLSSTPFFYRLHDIYQSSTVYLTFPSNRTKRYEHSLGTMALASELLFSSITNADAKVRVAFFEQLNAEFKELCKKTFTKGYNAHYFGKGESVFQDIVTNSKYNNAADNKNPDEVDRMVEGDIHATFSSNLLSDDALNHFSLHSVKIDGADNQDSTYLLSSDRERFIYQCILQAVRVVALFHDVGHPPYSHIIEKVLEDLYRRCKYDSPPWDSGKKEKLEDTLGRFLDRDKPVKFCFINTEGSSVSPHLHEQVGIHMFRMAIEFVMPDLLESIKKADEPEWTPKTKMIVTLYHITSIEFAAAILLEKNELFRSIHRLIDGVIDADRLDYVIRDSLSSGVDWGAIPYKRLIDSAKLYQVKPDGTIDEEGKSGFFIVSYPQKVSSDIEDFLVERYKIFARINFHHRCIKTSVALQSAIKILAEDYLCSPREPLSAITETGLEHIDNKLCNILKSDDPNNWENGFPVTISHDIYNLWTALGSTFGDESLKVLRWNDSWMISVLQSALLKIRVEENFETKFLLQAIRKKWHDVKDSSDWKTKSFEDKEAFFKRVLAEKKDEFDELCKNLEEFLLNKKAYYSLFKRGMDVKLFIDDVIRNAGLSIDDIKNQLESEKKKYYDALDSNKPLETPLWKCLDESGNSTCTSTSDATDAVLRLDRFLYAVEVGDLQLITSIFPPDGESAKEIICDVLKDAVENKELQDFKTYINNGRQKMGLPQRENINDPTSEIYLYNNQRLFKYNEFVSLKPQLKAIEQSILWLSVYVIPAASCANPDALLASLRLKCAEVLGSKIKKRYMELFPHHDPGISSQVT